MDTALPTLMLEKEVVCVARKSKAQVRRDIAAGIFPAPVKVGIRSSRWRGADIQAWLDSLISTRRAA